MSGGEIILNSGAFQGLLLGLKEVSDFTLEAKIYAISVDVTITMLDFFFLGWRLQRLDEESDKESNEESYDLTEEVIFFGWGEVANKNLGWKLA